MVMDIEQNQTGGCNKLPAANTVGDLIFTFRAAPPAQNFEFANPAIWWLEEQQQKKPMDTWQTQQDTPPSPFCMEKQPDSWDLQ